MDTITRLYATTDGRISRKQWWLGVLGLILASIVLSLITSLFGFNAWGGMPTIDPSSTDAAAISAATTEAIRRGSWASLIMFAILAYPSYCIAVKRRHDRDNNGLDVLIFMGLNVLMLVLQALGLGVTTVDLGNGVTMPAPSMWLGAVSILLGIFGIYLLVVLGFLRGTIGSNSYGADPALGIAATV